MAQQKKFSFLDIMNSAATKEANSGSNDFAEVYLSPYEVKPTESNFYSQENIEELADAILAVGQQQPTVLALTEGEYRIVSGHRRNAANILNIERGELQPEAKVRYLYKEMTPAILELSLLMGNALNRKLTPYEETEQAARLKAALLRAKKEDGLELKGRLRDIIADLLETSTTQVARMEKINATLTDEAKEQFKAGNIGITTAYETAKLQPEHQAEVAALAAGEEVKQKDIAEWVREKQQQEALDRAAETAALSKNVSVSDTKVEYSEKDFAIYNLRQLLLLADYLIHDDNLILQDIICKATELKGVAENG